MHDFQVNKTNFTQARLIENNALNEQTNLANGEIVVKVDSFALTANNITYAVLGDKLNYWKFFPTNQDEENNWGVIPVWGFAHVVASNNEKMPVGEKLFGYFPPANFLKMNATHITDHRFIDGSEHRSALPAGYNVYRRVSAEPGYDSRFDNLRMLLFPLHITSYCLWDYIKDNNWFDAEQVVIISASSKTSIGLAYGLNADEDAPQVIGMTSSRNATFVGDLNLYDSVVDYADVTALDKDKNTVVVDMSGNAETLQQIELHLGDKFKHSIQVGLTHWDAAQAESPLKNTPNEMFFAPGHIQKRIGEWGPKEFEQRSMAYMTNCAQRSASWLKFENVKGLSGMAEIYNQVCSGQIPPDQGIIVHP